MGLDLDSILRWFRASQSELGFQIGVALLCGAIVGLERQLRGKAIGIRTSILICLATQVFIRLSAELAVTGAVYDPTRVMGQIVTGVGFLGAGVIISKGGSVTGVTSAAVVWMLAAIGSTIGVGRALEALVLTIVVVFVLIGVRKFEQVFKNLRGAYDEPDLEDSEME
jgi:putative Mg2+ transporter-C (MgtC) family protein